MPKQCRPWETLHTVLLLLLALLPYPHISQQNWASNNCKTVKDIHLALFFFTFLIWSCTTACRADCDAGLDLLLVHFLSLFIFIASTIMDCFTSMTYLRSWRTLIMILMCACRTFQGTDAFTWDACSYDCELANSATQNCAVKLIKQPTFSSGTRICPVMIRCWYVVISVTLYSILDNLCFFSYDYTQSHTCTTH